MTNEASPRLDGDIRQKRAYRRFLLLAIGVVVILIAGALVYATGADSDGDGLTDWTEARGWVSEAGATYVTSPRSADTDGDGLTDREEAGERVEIDGTVAYAATSNPTEADSDGDGLDDRTELHGWTSQLGTRYRTAPLIADTDGDGLTDGGEAGALAAQSESGARTPFSDPTIPDTDSDGLDDAAEADLNLDAFAADTDGDGLGDADEVDLLGTAPDAADTDGDGFDDGYEIANGDSQGLDPLSPDIRVDASKYAWDFAQGAVLGELARGDSPAWIAGNLASGGSSLIPGVGWVVGGVADLRDAIGSAIHEDWVGSGFSIVGMAPAAGDAVAIPAKAARFVARHPELAATVGALVVSLKWVPDTVKAPAIRAVAPSAYDDLRASNVAVHSILKLQEGKVNLASLIDSTRRPGATAAQGAPFFKTGSAGEQYLASSYTGSIEQKVFSTSGCIDVCNPIARRVDVLVDGIAHESKVGRVYLTPGIRRQIESDAYQVEIGAYTGAEWHFFPSAVTNTLGASTQVLDLLNAKGIGYTIHLPK